VEVDGVNVTGAITVSNTGGWQSWQTVSVGGIPLAAGTHAVRLVADATAAECGTYFVNYNYFTFAIAIGSSGGTSTPFTGAPYPVPGRIEAENFDHGGEGVAYHDTTAGNIGGAYRPTDVDLAAVQNDDGNAVVGWVGVGEWLKYTVDVQTAGTYTWAGRIAAGCSGGRFHVEVDGVNVTGAITVSNTGGWQSWQTVSVGGIPLSAGTHAVRLVADATAAECGTYFVNYNYFTFAIGSSGGSSTPFTGTPYPVPGRIEAENFDHGGEGVAYHDTTAGNTGGAYRPTDVDLAAVQNDNGANTVGWVIAGEWLKYTVQVQSTGTYSWSGRVAAACSGGLFHVEVDGVDVTGGVNVPNTGGWQSWQTVSVNGIHLSAGARTVRLVADRAGAACGEAVTNWNYFEFQDASAPPPPSASNVVVYANDVPNAALHGAWAKTSDGSAANGIKLTTSDAGYAAPDAPLSSPTHYFDVSFNAVANTPYTIWLRLQALNNSKFNDAVWVQFSDALVNGASAYPINSNSGLLVNLATDGNATSLNGWGWQNAAYWLAQPTTVTFATTGAHTLRVQVREDGVQLDQIVLSPTTYLSSPPGQVSNDSTIVPKP
jgi:hypothetical protein